MNFVFERNRRPTPWEIPIEAQQQPQRFGRMNFPEVVVAARKNVEKGSYRTAERQYQTILAKDPNNLDALSNLGVVYFRTGKIGSAESTLKKALTIAPDDDFVLTTLGIVHYRQSRFDDALKELTKAIELNPNSATAHNYLGITASQKGRQQEAEKEMLQAIAEDPELMQTCAILISRSFLSHFTATFPIQGNLSKKKPLTAPRDRCGTATKSPPPPVFNEKGHSTPRCNNEKPLPPIPPLFAMPLSDLELDFSEHL